MGTGEEANEQLFDDILLTDDRLGKLAIDSIAALPDLRNQAFFFRWINRDVSQSNILKIVCFKRKNKNRTMDGQAL
jgi:hypothetical protein